MNKKIVGRTFDELVALLSTGPVDVLGLLPYSSNYVFLAQVGGDDGVLTVYKPQRGEQPLWDFPEGTLAAREVAAFKLSEAAGWNFVPPTVLREDAPLGRGSLQVFIRHDPDRHYFVLMEERPDAFEPFVAFDVVANNADRKAGHILEDESKRLWSVDHGVTFNVDPKLRTVIWDLAEKEISREVKRDLERLETRLANRAGLAGELGELLSGEEVDAALDRVAKLLTGGRYPLPIGPRHLPWPLV